MLISSVMLVLPPGQDELTSILNGITVIIATFNSCLNPILYAFLKVFVYHKYSHTANLSSVLAKNAKIITWADDRKGSEQKVQRVLVLAQGSN